MPLLVGCPHRTVLALMLVTPLPALAGTGEDAAANVSAAQTLDAVNCT